MKRLLMLLSLMSISLHGVELTYTDTETGPNRIPLGYPVPIPVDSLTPIDGFRTYNSLNLRHQQLAAESDAIEQYQIGQTINERGIWAYQLSDLDNKTNTGAREASALINGGIHAREWQSPEAVTGYMESLFDGQENQYIEQYLLDNLNLVLIPVLNIDGYLQTQRFPNMVTNTQAQPRDGRMRRKNMRGVDEILSAEQDNLLGIDLNRNNAPYWATSSNSSDSDTSIVHHGAGVASEPETQALQQAAMLAGEGRLRFYTDTHSFTQIYFTPLIGNARRDAVTASLANKMRSANGFKYRYGPSSAGNGIGTTDEYFANTYEIPSYTLEIEPRNSGADYGGFGVSHDGFILPNSEVTRMRQETAKATFTGLYTMTELPMLIGIEILDLSTESLQVSQYWTAEDGERQVVRELSNSLVAGTEYQLVLRFNKPMRWLQDEVVTNFGNLSQASGIDIGWLVKTTDGTAAFDIDTDAGAGEWLTAGHKQYKTDSYRVNFTMPDGFDWANTELLSIQINTTDMVGQSLDTNPATVSDWQQGHWVNYENTIGVEGDVGGIDQSMRIIDDASELYSNSPGAVEPQPEPTPTTPVAPPPVVAKSSSGGVIHWNIFLLFLAFSFARKRSRS